MAKLQLTISSNRDQQIEDAALELCKYDGIDPNLFGLEGQKTTRPGSLDGSIKRLWEWQPQPYWGQHPTRIALMRRFIAEMEDCPAAAEWKEENVKRHFHKLSRYLGVRIVRLPSPIRSSHH